MPAEFAGAFGRIENGGYGAEGDHGLLDFSRNVFLFVT
jgi:hypothetical protein